MRLAKMLVLMLAVAFLGGCLTTSSRMLTTQSPGVERIPTVIALFPLLTAEGPYHRGHWETGLRRSEQNVYIVPPAETNLIVSFDSQMMTNFLAAELSYRGFTLKELPVTASTGGVGGAQADATFSVSLDQLDRLYAEFGLDGLLIGNVAFMTDPTRPYEKKVRSIYLKLVDVKTLDVLCHFALPASQSGDDMGSVVTAVANEMARLAHLQVQEAEKEEDYYPPPSPAPQPEPPAEIEEPGADAEELEVF